MRKPLIVGNWKMYHTPSQGVKMVQALLPLLPADSETQVVICPPATGLCALGKELQKNNSAIALGAQNLHWQPEGAYTGEVSPGMLADLGVAYAIVGHSERREYFLETDEIVSKKAGAAAEQGLIPIVCVGETQAQREACQTLEWLEKQIYGSLAFWDGSCPLVVAYEPIWAIGTGLTATGDDAEAVLAFIRERLTAKWGQRVGAETLLLYGGSVKPQTIGSLMQQPNIDGVLVGGASLKAESFAQIINFK